MNGVLDNPLTVKELAERWTVHPDTVRAQMKAGTLKAFKIGGQFRITAEEVRRFENDRQDTSTPASIHARIADRLASRAR